MSTRDAILSAFAGLALIACGLLPVEKAASAERELPQLLKEKGHSNRAERKCELVTSSDLRLPGEDRLCRSLH